MGLFIDKNGLPETAPETTPVLLQLSSDKNTIIFIRVFKNIHEMLHFYMLYCYKDHGYTHFYYKQGLSNKWWYEIIKAWNDFPGSHAVTFEDDIDTEYLDRVLSMHLSAVLIQSSDEYDIVNYPMNVDMFEDSSTE